MRPHEEAKLLSPEELDGRLCRIHEYGACRGDGLPIEKAAAELRAHIAALEADKEALHGALQEAYEHNNFRPAEDILGQPHPGSALLSEHSKALVRARNEGLERAAETCSAVYRHHKKSGSYPMDMGGLALECESAIRAMKEAEG